MSFDPVTETASRWRIEGVVQGVGFRWFVARHAERLGLRGWVRNLPDGSVEVLAAGPPDAMSQLDQHLRMGPRLARVTHVERSEIPHGVVTSKLFEIR